ncbi:cAMP-binding domain of CRP or a regulatory subunit of cAMP-dependent protein kinases [Granulicatella balaenopterae]|uniref:cAMP-binding domain of CRP or a regulatory subunit of cAMP-dependent protein kinases n=1 Tax=Granulicatella balaenopterae TaxID=137733 RepID=A0A1H9MGG2_9LACT|nr:Crp/Fnr family transcriptional regulator [Granulicatella balaenopterae]SER22253.1 cAMP-binding domain of CRP or a regulatory subunit of cAMP-dependent protein kinases [Granulicatella balaenopterae]
MLLQNMVKEIEKYPEIKEILSSCPLEILSQIEIVEFEKEKFNLYQDCQYNYTYIVLTGIVKVYLLSEKGNQVVLDIYRRGNFIGEQEAIINRPYSASLINTTDVTLLRLHNREFVKWLNSDQQLSTKFITNLCDQLYHLTKRTQRYSLQSAREQICACLLSYHSKNKQVTRADILDEVDTSYRNLNRILKQLEELGIIKVGKIAIEIINLEKLNNIL